MKKIRIVISAFLLIISIVLYFLIHGSNNLLVVYKINSIIKIFPIFSGIKIHNIFVTSYLIDILWFISLIILSPFFFSLSNFINSLFIFFVGGLLEIMQLFFSNLGTFDYYDILCYFIIFLLYNILSKIIWIFQNYKHDDKKQYIQETIGFD